MKYKRRIAFTLVVLVSYFVSALTVHSYDKDVKLHTYVVMGFPYLSILMVGFAIRSRIGTEYEKKIDDLSDKFATYLRDLDMENERLKRKLLEGKPIKIVRTRKKSS